MRGAECDFCGLTQSDLAEEFDNDDMAEVLFEVSHDGKSMACQACAIGRDEFPQWEPDI